MKTRRIFTGIPLPEEAKNRVRAIQNTKIYPIKWMETDNLHITLNFLGELSDEQIAEAEGVMAEALSGISAFYLNLTRLAAKRHMLWLVPERSDELSDLKHELSRRFREKRIEKRERERYAPHILIAKQKNPRRKMRFEAKNFAPIKFRVDGVNLYESRLTPKAATHILIRKFPLV